MGRGTKKKRKPWRRNVRMPILHLLGGRTGRITKRKMFQQRRKIQRTRKMERILLRNKRTQLTPRRKRLTRREENNNSRLEEAKKAYEAWLDLIEEREEENMLFEEERKRILMWKPPWYAGGKALF